QINHGAHRARGEKHFGFLKKEDSVRSVRSVVNAFAFSVAVADRVVHGDVAVHAHDYDHVNDRGPKWR
ncbi:MAG TPA: hypothetical protein VF993_15745, partial [Myxococcales bacterium]